MTEWMKRFLRNLTGYPHETWNPEDDLENRVPDDVGVSKVGDFWYLGAIYGMGDDHQHVEIKLDGNRFTELFHSVIDRMADYTASGPQVRGGPFSGPPTPPASAS